MLSPSLSLAPPSPGRPPLQTPLTLSLYSNDLRSHFVFVFRWPFERHATKNQESPPLHQADIHTYYSTPTRIASISTSPSPLCDNEDPLPIPINTHTPTHSSPSPSPTHIMHKKGGDSGTEKTRVRASPQVSSHDLYGTRTSAPSAFPPPTPNTHTRARQPSVYRTLKPIWPPQIATVHAHISG